MPRQHIRSFEREALLYSLMITKLKLFDERFQRVTWGCVINLYIKPILWDWDLRKYSETSESWQVL